jgi:hypothetical protein
VNPREQILGGTALPLPARVLEVVEEAVRVSVPLSQAEIEAYFGPPPTLQERAAALRLRATRPRW